MIVLEFSKAGYANRESVGLLEEISDTFKAK